MLESCPSSRPRFGVATREIVGGGLDPIACYGILPSAGEGFIPLSFEAGKVSFQAPHMNCRVMIAMHALRAGRLTLALDNAKPHGRFCAVSPKRSAWHCRLLGDQFNDP